jgi:hypothetical protein
MPIFGFLIILPVWAGNAYDEGLILEKTGRYSKRRSGGFRRRFNFTLSFKVKEGSYEQKNCGYQRFIADDVCYGGFCFCSR